MPTVKEVKLNTKIFKYDKYEKAANKNFKSKRIKAHEKISGHFIIEFTNL